MLKLDYSTSTSPLSKYLFISLMLKSGSCAMYYSSSTTSSFTVNSFSCFSWKSWLVMKLMAVTCMIDDTSWPSSWSSFPGGVWEPLSL